MSRVHENGPAPAGGRKAPCSELDELRRTAILASLAGFPFLLSFSVAWTAAGAVSYLVPPEAAGWTYVFVSVPAVLVAMAVEKRTGYVAPLEDDPLVPLALQLMFVQMVAFPAIALVWDLAPAYMPVAWAAVVGAHFLPFQWIYRTRLYGVLGVAVAAAPYALGAVIGPEIVHYAGFVVGGALFIGALGARAHAAATWAEHRRAVEAA